MRVLVKIAALLLLAAACAAGQSAQGDARELYNALSALRVDSEHTYYVRDVALRRDAVRLSFQEGKLAFLSPHRGRITGLVFTGRGRVLAIPRDPAEKQSVARFLGAPLVDQSFSRAYIRFTDGTAEEILRQLKEAGAQPVSETSFGDEWNAVASSLNSWHSLRILADWLAKETQPYFYAGLQGDASGAFDVLVDSRREEQVLLGQPRWVDGVWYYDVWASFLRSGSDASLAPMVPVAYSVETTIQPDRSLTGVTIAELKALREGERMVPLELSRYLRVESVTDEAGQPLAFFQNEEVTRHQIAARGNDSLFVVKATPARAGEIIRLRIAYRGRVISDAGNGVYFVGERGSWYPHVGGSDRFVSFDLKFQWPRKLELVATGRKVEEQEEGEWKTGRWKSEVPIPVAGFNLGNYVKERVDGGKFAVDMYANENLEVAVLNRFVRIQRPPAQPRTPGGGLRIPSHMALSLPDIPPPSPAAVLKELGNDVAEAIRFNEKLSGPFPYEKLSVAQIPGSFGQGWPGLLYLSTLSFLPPSAQSRAGIGERTQEQFLELVPVHEVVHQWWGNAVSWPSYRDQWIHEGLANYIALLYADSKRANEKLLTSWLEYYRRDLASREPEGEGTIENAGPLALGYRLRSSRLPSGYVQVVYGKGTWVFHMLRTMLREPGAKNPDARFTQVLGSLMESHRFRGLTTDDLRHALEKRMTPAMDLEGGRSLEWFFDQWVTGTGIPRYSVSFQVTPQGDGFVVKGKLKQSGVPDTFLATVPLYVRRTGARPALLGNVVVSGPETSFKFVTKTAPKKILIDPNFTLLAVTE